MKTKLTNKQKQQLDKNDLNCTTDVNEWLETIKQIDILGKNMEGSGPNPDRVTDLWLTECSDLNLLLTERSDFNFDYEAVKEASGYITAPVFIYKTKAEAVSNKTFKTMQDLKEYLKDKKYLLYMIVVSVKTKGCDSASVVPYRLDKPELRYTFRGHIVK